MIKALLSLVALLAINIMTMAQNSHFDPVEKVVPRLSHDPTNNMLRENAERDRAEEEAAFSRVNQLDGVKLDYQMNYDIIDPISDAPTQSGPVLSPEGSPLENERLNDEDEELDDPIQNQISADTLNYLPNRN